MLRSFLALYILLCLLPAGDVPAQAPADGSILLPNGWSLSPAGRSILLSSDLPLNMAVSPDGGWLAVTNNGHGKQTIDLIDLKSGRLVDQVEIGKA